MSKKGVLLVNLGTPDSPSVSDVRKYLDEFLNDGRVIDINPIGRTLLVNGIIVPIRGPKSAKTYQAIWDKETPGSPLMHYSLELQKLVQSELKDTHHIALGMRYQSPSIENALLELKQHQVDDILVIPLFPQYASATSGSVHQKVMEIVSKWQSIPSIKFLHSFYDYDAMIEVFAENAKKYDISSFDHILFSYHGLPQRQLRKADDSKAHCLKVKDCCKTITPNNKFCYSAQCHATSKCIADKLQLSENQYTVCFQSRLGRDPWAQPYTSEVIKEMAAKKYKRILVFSPAFVADCLETIFEIAEEYQEEFVEMGGEKIQLVESLNTHPKWIKALSQLILSQG